MRARSAVETSPSGPAALQYAYGSDRTNVPAAAAALAFGCVYVIRHAVVDYAVRGTYVKAFSAAYADPGYSIFLGII